MSNDDTQSGGKTADGRVIPDYHMVEQTDFDLADHTVDSGLRRCTYRPKQLVFCISLPCTASSKDVDLDVENNRLFLLSKVPGVKSNYFLDVTLSYLTLSNESTAKFDKSKHMLTVTLPVRTSSTPPFASVVEAAEDDVKESGVENAEANPKRDAEEIVVVSQILGKEKSKAPNKKAVSHDRWIDESKRQDLSVKSREKFATDLPLLTNNDLVCLPTLTNDQNERLFEADDEKVESSKTTVKTEKWKRGTLWTVLLNQKTEQNSCDDLHIGFQSAGVDCSMKNKESSSELKRDPIFFPQNGSIRMSEKLLGSDTLHVTRQNPVKVPAKSSMSFQSNLIFSLD